MDCIFCQIVEGKIPCHKLYEDEQVISFLDIFPAGRGHSLIVPKLHYADLQEAPAGVWVLGQVMLVSQKVAAALTTALETEGFNIFLNNGEVAGQKIPHLHFHILPRYLQDGVRLQHPPYTYKEGEIEQIRDKVTAALPIPSRQQLLTALQKAAADKRLNCAHALSLAKHYQVPSKELGSLLNQLQIKLRNCQLGCF